MKTTRPNKQPIKPLEKIKHNADRPPLLAAFFGALIVTALFIALTSNIETGIHPELLTQKTFSMRLVWFV